MSDTTNAVSVDFECFYSSKLKYGLRQLIAEEYVQHERFDCYLVSVCDGNNVWAGHPRDLNWSALAGKLWLSHNRYFDNTVYNELVRRSLAPSIERAGWECTANLTSYLCGRRALQSAVEHLYKTRISKDYRDVADGKNWPNDYTEAEMEQVRKAGRVDAHWCWRLWNDFSSRWPEWERVLSNLTIDQGMLGVALDVSRLNNYIAQAHEMRNNAEAVIPWMSGAGDEEWDSFTTRPTSTRCIVEQCRRMRIPAPPTKTDDEEGYEAWETKYGNEHRWIPAVSAWRAINKFYATLRTLKNRLRPDGTVPFALKYFGAHTGRWSGDAKVNFQNMRKKPIFCEDTHGMMETDESKIDAAMDQFDDTGKYPEWVRYALDFRSLVIPRPGKKMIVCDLAQIEPRVLAWLGGNHKLLKMISQGMGIYEAFARSQMGYDGPKFDKEMKRSDYYKMVKINVLGLGYGAGWEKFITIAKTMGGLDITKNDPPQEEVTNPFTGDVTVRDGYGQHSRGVVKSFRENNKHITELWARLDAALKSSVGQDFVMTLPSGRRMCYRDVRLVSTVEKDPVTGKPRTKTEVTAEVGERRFSFYGGKLTENITQAVARDVFGVHLVRMTQAGLRCLFTAHDEAIMEVDQDVKPSDIEKHMSYCPDWLPGCPIAAEASEVAHYQK